MTKLGPRRAAMAHRCAAGALLVLLVLYGSRAPAQGALQGFTVTPVTFELAAGKRATILTIRNQTDQAATFQVRPYVWTQPAGTDQLEPTEALLVSPPLGVLAAGSNQVVRLVLRQPVQGRETAYRILLDQIPAQQAPGQVGFVLRFSLPVFAEPPDRMTAQVRWIVELQGDSASLVANNDGGRRQVVRDMKLKAPDGRSLSLEANVSPYILAGGVRRWRILDPGPWSSSSGTLTLTAHADTGEIGQAVPVRRAGP